MANWIQKQEGSPTTPASGKNNLYFDTSGVLKSRNSSAADTTYATGSGTAYVVGGTDVAVADGGTGASTAATARTNLGAAGSVDMDGRYQQLIRSTGRASANVVTASGVYVVQPGGAINTQAAGLPDLLYLDPDDHLITGRSTKLRVVAAAAVNDTAPAMTLTIGLYPVTNVTGAGPSVADPNFGTVITGSTVAFASPAANSESAQTYTADFDLPAEGWYGIGVAASAAMTTNSAVLLVYRLERRNV